MPAHVIMPALELAQDSGKVLQWLRAPGDTVRKGDPLVEIETDKATVEIEAPASGVLREVTAQAGDVIPVGQTIALIFGTDEAGAAPVEPAAAPPGAHPAPATPAPASAAAPPAAPRISPLAQKVAEQHGVDLAKVAPSGRRIEKADVLAFVERAAAPRVGTIWRVMVERMTQSWTTAPQFHLVREVNASRLVAWRERAVKHTGVRVTYTDLLVKLVAAAIGQHPGVNASWQDGGIVGQTDINIGLAVTIDDGLVVPVVHRADRLGLAELVAQREALVGRAQAGRLRPADITGGGFTISNLGMYGVDGFTAIVNPPQAAILAVGRIADRVVALNGQPAVQPMMVLTLSCDHRALDGARGAQFLATLAELIEEPLALLT